LFTSLLIVFSFDLCIQIHSQHNLRNQVPYTLHNGVLQHSKYMYLDNVEACSEAILQSLLSFDLFVLLFADNYRRILGFNFYLNLS